MPEKSASISQQRLLGMAWAARTGRLDTSKIEDKDWRDKIDKIANSDKFPDKSLKKMASTKHRDEETDKLIPYRIGKGTPEDPERKRKPYKKKLQEGFSLMGLNEFLLERQSLLELKFQDFYNGYIDALSIMGDKFIPNVSEMFNIYKDIIENVQLNPGMNVMGMGPVSMPGNPGTTTSFHSQEPGSGDIPYYKKDDEDEEDEDEDDK
jgi:hypothetical protein